MKLGPGSDTDTLKMLDRLPRRPEGTIVDVGCGTGRQTLVLADRLRLPIQAVDAYAPFLADLARRAKEARMAHLIQRDLYTHSWPR